MGKEAKKKNKTKNKTKNKETDEKPIFRSKKYHLIITIIVILCVIGAVWFILNPAVVKAEAKAQLVIESGTVQVRHSGESWVSAENGMDLYESDSVRTGESSSASIILFKSSIIRLDSNTEVTLQEIIQEEETRVSVNQDSGRTWNTINKISGIDDYEVQTPTTVASVRGTSFEVKIMEDGNTTVGVGNGTVNVSRIRNGIILGTTEVHENKSVTVDPDEIEKPLDPETYVKDDWVLENLQKDEELEETIYEDLYNKIEPHIPELKEFYNMTDQELDVLIDGYIKGYFEIPPNAPDWVKELFELP